MRVAKKKNKPQDRNAYYKNYPGSKHPFYQTEKTLFLIRNIRVFSNFWHIQKINTFFWKLIRTL